jgi:septal ring-binding cell division protein DamX/predicted  nucleic acid-binding Zn-ribbon protein
VPDAEQGGDDRGHKKRKQAKHRAKVDGDLARISNALRELRGRVSDLHALHLDREGRAAGLAARLDAIGSEQARAREAAGALDGRVDALRAKVDALRAEAAVITDTLADLAVQPDRDTALFALEDRIQEAEETLAGLLAMSEQHGMNQTQDALAERLEGLAQALAASADRLAALEGQVARADTVGDAGGPALARLDQGLAALGANVDDRIGGIERDIATLRDQNKRWREAERAWAEERLHGVRQGLVGGIALLALLLIGGFVATWWHGERQLDLIAARISVVEQGTGERLSAVAAPPGQDAGRLGEVIGKLGAAMQGIQSTNAEIGAWLAKQPEPESFAALSAAAAAAPSLADLLDRVRALEDRGLPDVSKREGPGAEASESKTQTPPDIPAEIPAEIEPVLQDQTQPPVADPLAPTADLSPSGPGEQGAEGSADAPAAPKAAAAALADPASSGLPDSAASEPAAVLAAEPGQPAAAPAEERYTLQLIGFRSQGSIAPFVREHGLVGEARWLRTPGRGRDWYLVLLGDYGSRQEAQDALSTLPAGLIGLSPVVRVRPFGTEPVASE